MRAPSTHTHTHTHALTHTQQRQSILPRKVHGKVEVAVAVEVDARGTESNATEEEEGLFPGHPGAVLSIYIVRLPS